MKPRSVSELLDAVDSRVVDAFCALGFAHPPDGRTARDAITKARAILHDAADTINQLRATVERLAQNVATLEAERTQFEVDTNRTGETQ